MEYLMESLVSLVHELEAEMDAHNEIGKTFEIDEWTEKRIREVMQQVRDFRNK